MKIGFIAMSGIRACDQELLELGLTLPGFVERSKTIASLPSLGLLTLAGMTAEHHERCYIEIEDIRKCPSIPEDFDLVALSSFSAQMNEAYELADRYRAMGVPVVLGGLHATALPAEAAEHADAVVVGEGEPIWKLVLRDAENHCLRPYYRATNSHFELKDAPMPAFELLDINKYNRLTVQTSRGCPYHCEFCASSILLTSRYKQKPIDRVLAEIDRICELWPRPFIEFADDNSFVNRSYWKDLCNELKSRNIRWFTETDLSVYKDDELLQLLFESGCVEILIGFESPEHRALEGIEIKCDWKSKQFHEYKDSIRRIQEHGIRVNGCFVIGLDHHGPDIFDRVFDFAQETELFDVQITIQTPFPGTPLYQRLKQENRMIYDNAWERCTLFDVNFQPKQMNVEQFRVGFRELGKQIYNEENTKWRRRNFYKKYRQAKLSGEGKANDYSNSKDSIVDSDSLYHLSHL